MISKNKDLISGINIPNHVFYPKSRPFSAVSSKTSQDPSWMRLFRKKSSSKAKLKTSKLHPYSYNPKVSHKIIRPKFMVNTFSLFNILKNVPSIEEIDEEKYCTSRYIPEFSIYPDKGHISSRQSLFKSESQRNFTSRPATATNRTQKSSRKYSETNFLPDKGNEFVTEILGKWDAIEKTSEKKKTQK